MKKLDPYTVIFWVIFGAMALGGFYMIMVAFGIAGA
jgi:hypothetical protein